MYQIKTLCVHGNVEIKQQLGGLFLAGEEQPGIKQGLGAFLERQNLCGACSVLLPAWSGGGTCCRSWGELGMLVLPLICCPFFASPSLVLWELSGAGLLCSNQLKIWGGNGWEVFSTWEHRGVGWIL